MQERAGVPRLQRFTSGDALAARSKTMGVQLTLATSLHIAVICHSATTRLSFVDAGRYVSAMTDDSITLAVWRVTRALLTSPSLLIGALQHMDMAQRKLGNTHMALPHHTHAQA